MTQLTPHFTAEELVCRCGCGALPSMDFVHDLEELRSEFGYPLIIISGARCANHNVHVSTSGPEGPHVPLVGRPTGAVDISIYGELAFELMKVVGGFPNWNGIGLLQHGAYQSRFIHLDNHHSTAKMPRPRIWTY